MPATIAQYAIKNPANTCNRQSLGQAASTLAYAGYGWVSSGQLSVAPTGVRRGWAWSAAARRSNTLGVLCTSAVSEFCPGWDAGQRARARQGLLDGAPGAPGCRRGLLVQALPDRRCARWRSNGPCHELSSMTTVSPSAEVATICVVSGFHGRHPDAPGEVLCPVRGLGPGMAVVVHVHHPARPHRGVGHSASTCSRGCLGKRQ